NRKSNRKFCRRLQRNPSRCTQMHAPQVAFSSRKSHLARLPNGHCCSDSALAAAHQVNFKLLLRPTEELLILPAFEIFFESGLSVKVDAMAPEHARYQYVLLAGHAAHLVVRHF